MAQQGTVSKSGPKCPLVPSIAVAAVAAIEVYVDSKDEQGNPRKLYLGDLPPDATREDLKEAHGGGHFELHAQPQRGTEVLAVVTCSIAGEPLWHEDDPSNDGRFDQPPMDPRSPQPVFAIPAEGGVASGLPPEKTQEIIEKTQATRDERSDQHALYRMMERQSQSQTNLLLEVMRGQSGVMRAPAQADPAQSLMFQQHIQMLSSQMNDMLSRHQRETGGWAQERLDLMSRLNAMQTENHNLHRDLSDAQAQLKWMVTAAGGTTGDGKDGKPNMLQSVIALAGTPAGQGIISALMKGALPPGSGGPPPGMIPPPNGGGS